MAEKIQREMLGKTGIDRAAAHAADEPGAGRNEHGFAGGKGGRLAIEFVMRAT